MAYEALMRSDMEALRSPATIMKLAQEQGALCEIERLTFFKSLETFDHPRNMQIIAEGVETAAELRQRYRRREYGRYRWDGSSSCSSR